jgi:hypothetical protein
LNVNPVARREFDKFLLRPACEVEQAFVDREVQARLIVEAETVSDPRREILRYFRLQEYVDIRAKRRPISPSGLLTADNTTAITSSVSARAE